MAQLKKSKNQIRRERHKLRKVAPQITKEVQKPSEVIKPRTSIKHVIVEKEQNENPSTTGKIFESELDALLTKPEFEQFKQVFDRFYTQDADDKDFNKGDIIESDEDNENVYDEASNNENVNGTVSKLSKKKLRKAEKIPLAELKANAKYPELVQWYDSDATDPYLTITIKSQKNCIPVPSHWQLKREYLSGRRLIEKKAFSLPKFISDTGITDMRDTTKDDDTTLKQRTRERVQPKLNRLDLDYQRLHDAFFKFQTKPRMLKFGDLFFEGRETEELDVSHFRPGVISNNLKDALGIPNGAPPPWVTKMQMFGPPPSYPELNIPGYNSSLEINQEEKIEEPDEEAQIDKEPFGKLVSYEDEPEDEEEDGEQEDDDEEEEEEGEEEDEAVFISETELSNMNRTQEKQEVIAPSLEGVREEELTDEEDVPLAHLEVPEEETTNLHERKPLYEVLKEEKSSAEFLSSGKVYRIPSKRTVNAEDHESEKRQRNDTASNMKNDERDKEESKEESDEDDDEEGTGKFRF